MFIIIYSRYIPYDGMTIFPFIILKEKGLEKNEVLMNHEKIHIQQQIEMLIIPFYILYGLDYLRKYIKYKNHDDAYFNIVFEREAYQNEQDLTYLKKRKFWNWRIFFK
ncbi:MAG: hypothetical protein EAZ44_06285 [Cytophagia bacterium]|nr:MAG: hypothetical protein EAZ44_06285 [Cytophagia bacterium]TAG39595.1 MAG: hypothetical protein EAZ31_09000 [Cytophagia bacterium]